MPNATPTLTDLTTRRPRPGWLTLYALFLLMIGAAGLAACLAAGAQGEWPIVLQVAPPAALALLAGVGLLRGRYWGLTCALLLMLVQITTMTLGQLVGVERTPSGFLLPVVTAVVILLLRRQRDLLE